MPFSAVVQGARDSLTSFLRGAYAHHDHALPHHIEVRPVGLARAHAQLQRLHRIYGDRPFTATLTRHTSPTGSPSISIRTARDLVGFAPAADTSWWHEQLTRHAVPALQATCRLERFERGDGSVGYQPLCVVNVRLDYGEDVERRPVTAPMLDSDTVPGVETQPVETPLETGTRHAA